MQLRSEEAPAAAKLTVRRLGYALGAEITGVDLSRPLDDATFAAIEDALREHIMLCFPKQHLEHSEMTAFCGRFGELHVTRPRNQHPENPDVFILTNKALAIAGGEVSKTPPVAQWHTDFSSNERPATMTFLMAKQLPEVGGDTMFSNTYLAYEALSPEFRKMIDPMVAVHDVALGAAYGAVSNDEKAKKQEATPPVAHPLVRVHPETGRKCLFIADRVRNFLGMTVEESKPLIDFLLAHATRYEISYRHRWTPNDFVMWDNRCSLHFAVQDYDLQQPRNMLRCSITGPKIGYAIPDVAAS